jgi:hypothetical protein
MTTRFPEERQSTANEVRSYAERILEALGINPKDRRVSSFAFSRKPPPGQWEAFTFEIPVPLYFVRATEGTYGQVRTLASGIKADNYILVADLGNSAILVMRRVKKGENVPLVVPVRKEEDYERIANILKKFNFSSDELTAHAAVSSAVEQLRIGAERYYTNRGLFSNYYLNERLFSSLSKRGRNPQKESSALLSQFGGEFPTTPEQVGNVLAALGYELHLLEKTGHKQYSLKYHSSSLDVSCITTGAESLDTKTGDEVVPSYQAVASLREFRWVILTNGRFWRLYSSRVQSSSTNYFEVDMDSVVAENDPRVGYFVGLFSSSSFLQREGVTDIDLTLDNGIKYAKEIEEDLRAKVFDGQLFLNLVRGTVGHSLKKKYSQTELEEAKATALKLLYRLLFVLYAESKMLLPVEDKKYSEISLGGLRYRLPALEKEPDSASAWKALQTLFTAISKGSPEASVPAYDGALFDRDESLDSLTIENRFLIPALRDLTEFEGRGIDYQNLGVRHLGSLYEALLEYSVRQADQDLVIYKDEILDASYVADVNAKPQGYIRKGDLYLTAGGLARKGTGSYFTPDEIVNYLVRNGLESHLRSREEQFLRDMIKLRSITWRDGELEEKTVNDLLGIRVVDPAMGSGHFLVTAVEEITRWIIGILKENPDAPLQKLIEEDRQTIIREQLKNGISLDEALLTDNVILKRMVMKRCVYGVDVNPLAVELAKLSLWLDSFTIGTPLTFLDHHIRCGDALIGLWLENIAGRTFESTLDAWTGTLSEVVSTLFWKTSTSPDLTLEQVDQSRKSYRLVRDRTEPVRILLDLEVASILEPDLGKKLTRNVTLIHQVYQKGEKQKPEWWGRVEEGLRLARKYEAFHWEFEFPEAFTEGEKGFDLVVMNPPWDAVKPDDDDFFSVYEPRFRRIPSKPQKRRTMQTLLKDPHISQAYQDYKERIEKKLLFFKASGEFVRRGSGDTNLWKLFLERSLKLLSKGGSLSLVIPSGIVTDEGAKQLREALFEGKIDSMYEFENKYGIFPDIHRGYKFVLLSWHKANPTESFKAAFYLHDLKSLSGGAEQEKFVEVVISLVKKSAPDSLSIPEIRNEKQLRIFTKLYDMHPLLSDPRKGWTVSFIRELDRTNDSDLFRTDGKGWPLIEGKNFHQFIPDYEKTTFTIDPTAGLKRTASVRYFARINEQIHRTCRLAFRGVASSTNVRAMIACILPPSTFCPNNATLTVPQVNGATPEGKEYAAIIGYLAGIMNSFVFDFLMRARTTMNMNFFYVYQTPVPAQIKGKLAERISRIAIRLNSTDTRFEKFSELVGIEAGPLTMKERLNLSAELNALVARHYGLSRQELKTIMESFEGFEEDRNLESVATVNWNDNLMRKFNGEVRKRVLPYFDKLVEEMKVER